MRPTILLAAVLLLSGCASTYRQDVMSAPAARLERNKAVAIATPAPGRFEGTVYSASGRMTAGETRAAFARFSDKVKVSEKCADIVCLRGEVPGTDYFVVPEILHWEDRNTAWSGRPDRIEIKITIYGAGPEPIGSTVFSGTSKWATLGGDLPEHLLPEPMNSYVGGLF